MSALDIPPHPRSASRLAVTALGLIAAFALATGYLRQVVAMAPEPIAAGEAGLQTSIAEATPAPEPTLQVAEAPPRRAHDAEPVDISEGLAPAATDPAPAADASASAPDSAPATPPAETAAPSEAPTS
jgi:hypothetical protein